MFAKSKHLQRFFDQISTDFARIFIKSKFLGLRLHPRLLNQWSCVSDTICKRFSCVRTTQSLL